MSVVEPTAVRGKPKQQDRNSVVDDGAEREVLVSKGCEEATAILTASMGQEPPEIPKGQSQTDDSSGPVIPLRRVRHA